MSRQRRVVLGFVDQGFSSGANFVFVIALARAASVEDFGRLSLVMVAVLAVLGVTRGLIGVHLTALGGKPEQLRAESRFGLALAIAVGGIASTVGCVLCAAFDLSSAAWLLAATPLIVTAQDTLRFVAVASGSPGHAVASDALWTFGSLLALLMTVVEPATSLFSIAFLWPASAVAAALVLWILAPVRPAVKGITSWFRLDLRERSSFGLEGAIATLNGTLVLLIVTATLGLAATASLRGAGTIIGPITLIMGALPLVLVPELARLGQGMGGVHLWRRLRWVGLIISGAAIAVGSLGIWLPESAGEALLGETWVVARDVLPILGLEYAALSWSHAAAVGLRALGAGRRLLALRASAAGVGLSLVLLLSYIGDVILVAAGLAVLAAVFAVISIRTLLRTSAREVMDARG